MNFKTLLISIILTSVFFVAGTSLAMTDSERQALIAQIQAQIAQLVQQLTQLQSDQQGTASWCHTFNSNLGYANSGSEEVVNLHSALQKENIFYSPDDITTYSTGTSKAVIQFQAKYGISPRSGYVGQITRIKLNTLYGCEETTIQTPISTPTPTPTPITTCNTSWSCVNWTACSNGQQTRSCTDSNSCGIITDKPAIIQNCATACVPSCSGKTCGADNGCGGKCQIGTCPSSGTSCANGQCVCANYTAVSYSCTSWSACSNGQQTRSCTLPVGTCYKASTTKPSTTQSCGATTTPTTPTTSCIAEHGRKNLPSQSNILTQPCCSGLVYVANPSLAFSSSGTGTCELPTFPKYDGQSCTLNSGCQSGFCVNYVCSTEVAPACSTTAGVASSVNLKVNGFDGPISGGNYDENHFSNVTLSWTSSNVACCKVSGDWNTSGTGFDKNRNTSGSELQLISAQHPGSSYTFTISCTGVNNSVVSDSAIVNVNAPFVELKIADSGGNSPVDGPLTRISGYDAGILQWSTINSTSCTATTTTSCSTAGGNTCPSSTIPLVGTWQGTKAISGNQSLGNLSNIYTGIVLPLTFTLTCTGLNGTSSDSVTLNIAKPLTVGMTGNVSSSTAGKSVLLSWTSTGATSCRGLDDWSGTKATSGSETVGPFASSGTNVSKTFTIFCEGPLGTVRDTKPFIIE